MIPVARCGLAGIALVLSLAPGAVLAAQSLAGDWRPKGADTADPALTALDCAPGDQDCEEEHGTFVTDTYLRIVQDEETGALAMTSTGALSAAVSPRKGRERLFDVAMDGGGQASLHLGSMACGGVKACFEISGTSDATALADGVYVPVVPLPPDKSLTMSIKDRFGSVPPNMDLAGHCYDITTMGLDTFTDSQGCRQQIFEQFGEMDPDDYTVTSYGDEKMVAIPYGWKYLPISKTYGANSARILDSASDVVDSHQRTIGVNVSLGLGPVNFSVSHNTTTKRRTEDMYEHSLTYSEYHYIKTDFALVVDKANARLAAPFYAAITEAAKARKPDFASVIAEFGTHYAYATTMGERGKLLSTITSENVSKLHEEGVDVSTAVTVGVSVPIGALGEAKASTGVNTGTSDDHFQKMASTLGQDYGNYVCEGGMSCNGMNASGGISVPVLLDLRPLSDLLAPPFFSEIDDLPALRQAFAQAISDYAFGGDAASGDPSARFYEATGAAAACWSTYEAPTIGNSVNTACTMQGVTVTDGETTMSFGDAGADGVMTAPGPSIVIASRSEVPLTASAMVTRQAQDCSLAASDRQDTTPMPAEALTGTFTFNSTTFGSDGNFFIDFVPGKCVEVSGGRSINGGAGLTVMFTPRSAVDLLQH
jgi:hypothetical protein